MEDDRTRSLLQFMANEGLMPSSEEDLKRKDVVTVLKQVVSAWIKKVAWQRRLPKHQIGSTSAIILTCGSYGLGVHESDSDIDALCVGPYFVTMTEDFFIVLHNMLQNRPEVSEIHCVKDAEGPLMCFKFNGISINLPYAQLNVLSVPKNLDILNPFLRTTDETGWQRLSRVRTSIRILQLVPNLENFQLMLRCLRLWAKRRGVYGNLVGFFGGVHLAILAAFVCQIYPDGSINFLISKFFETFALWPWPTPVMLQDEMMPMAGDITEMPSLISIRLPFRPYEYCHSNVTRSTFQRIRIEFLRGHEMTRDLLKPDFGWSTLFEPFPYTKKHTRFVRIFLSASNQDELGDWIGWVKSSFHSLLAKLEEAQGLCTPNPTEYVDPAVSLPNIVFYWGLQPGRSNFIDINSIEDDFISSINGYQGFHGTIELSLVEASQLPKTAEFDSGSRMGSKKYWKIHDYNQQREPLYSQHLSNYLVGYIATEGDTEEYSCAESF